ncbi:MAG TPA: DNA internalization-related competence protein ComEC/Rec2 [Bacillota bacterium]|nr:DNA internalization-related competence protein ComEC/Rec2 [Bacillota bacterium]
MWIAYYFLGLIAGKLFLVDVLLGKGESQLPAGLSSPMVPFWLGLEGLFLLGVVTVFTVGLVEKKWPGRRGQGLPLTWAGTVLFLTGWVMQWLFLQGSTTPLLNHLGKGVMIRGWIAEQPKIREDWASYVVSVRQFKPQGQGQRQGQWQQGRGRIVVQVAGASNVGCCGDLIEVGGLAELPDAATNPGQFDYRRYLSKRGIYLLVKASGEQFRIADRGAAYPLARRAIAIRSRLADNLTALFPAEEGQFLTGLVLGETGTMSQELRDTFNQTGLGHLLSVSGYHVALVGAMVVLLGTGLGWSGSLIYASTVGSILVYALICGLSPPVVRSAVMACIGTYGALFNLRRHWPTALGLAACLTTIPNPQVITEPAYQLTFAATWAILAVAPELSRWGARLFPVMPRWLLGMVAVPLAAQLGTWPLVAFHFNQLSPLSILANLLLVDLAGVILLLGIACALTGMVSLELAAVFQWGLGRLAALFLMSAQGMARIPLGVINVVSPPIWSIVVYYCLLMLLVSNPGRLYLRRLWQLQSFHQSQLRPVWLGVCTLGAALWLAVLCGWPTPAGLQVTFLDVGEGDCIFIKTPGGKNILLDTGPVQVDAGGRKLTDAGARVVVPFLRSQGVNFLDLLMLSHPHQDHTGGAEAVLDNLSVAAIIMPTAASGGQGEEKDAKVQTLANQRKIPVLQGSSGLSLAIDHEVKLTLLGPEGKGRLAASSPQADTSDPEANLNNHSLVLQLEYGDHCYLFTGDAEQPELDQLMTESLARRVTVLKLPHHGSKNGFSPSFIERTGPVLGVVSVGANYYGHPSINLLRYFRERAIPLLRTDTFGAVHFSDDGITTVVTTFNSMDSGQKERILHGLGFSGK